jgi:hypothetical protein
MKKLQRSKSSPFMKEYEIENFKFRYFDESSKIKMVIDSLNHKGTEFAALDLVTKSLLQSFAHGQKVNYMNNVALTLDAVLGIDLNTRSKYVQRKQSINQCC